MRGSSTPPPLTGVLDAAGAWLPRQLGRVEDRLGEVVGAQSGPLETEARSTLLSGGKRMRPLLALVCAGPSGGERAVRGATAVELVHMATLVHDDVLDAAPLRRGAATVFSRAGRNIAVATGDLLYARAFAELSAEPGDSEQVDRLSAASVSLALGELAQRSDAFDLSVGEARYERRCLLKTAALFETACAIGSPSAEGDQLVAFGRRIGLAFQMLDDVLDIVGPPERTGKACGTDLVDGTVNLPMIEAIRRDRELARVELRGLDRDQTDALCQRIIATGAIEVVRVRARGLVDRAVDSLAAAPIDDERRSLLELVAAGVVERYS